MTVANDMDALTGEYQAALHEMIVNFKRAVDLAVMRQDPVMLDRLNALNTSFDAVLEANEKIHAYTAESLRGIQRGLT